MSEQIFNDFRRQNFLPANEAYRDDLRKALDRAVLVDLLKLQQDVVFQNLSILRSQWCTEPRGKTTRP